MITVVVTRPEAGTSSAVEAAIQITQQSSDGRPSHRLFSKEEVLICCVKTPSMAALMNDSQKPTTAFHSAGNGTLIFTGKLEANGVAPPAGSCLNITGFSSKPCVETALLAIPQNPEFPIKRPRCKGGDFILRSARFRPSNHMPDSQSARTDGVLVFSWLLVSCVLSDVHRSSQHVAASNPSPLSVYS